MARVRAGRCKADGQGVTGREDNIDGQESWSDTHLVTNYYSRIQRPQQLSFEATGLMAT